MIKIKPENTSKKLDSLGRITIPKHLRQRLYIKDNDTLELFTLDYEDRTYICISPVDTIPAKYVAARDVLEELGAEIPNELLEIFAEV